MAERKTGVIPLDYFDNMEDFTDKEIVELLMKTIDYLKGGDLPSFSDRALKVRFTDHKSFFDDNLSKFHERVERMKRINEGRTQNDDDTTSHDIVQHRDDIAYENENVYENENEITKKKRKPKEKISFAKDLIENYSQNFRLVEALYDYVDMRKKIRSPLTEKALKLNLTKLSQITLDEEEAIEIVNQSIEHGWKAFYPLKTEEHKKKTRQEELRDLYEKYKREEEQNDTRRDDSMPQYTFPDIPLLEDGEW